MLLSAGRHPGVTGQAGTGCWTQLGWNDEGAHRTGAPLREEL